MTSTIVSKGPTKLKDANELCTQMDVFIFDCDGVIWKGDSLISGVDKTIVKLRALGKKIFFVTNNSTKSRKGYLKKFAELGLLVDPEEILSSSFAASAYLQQHPLPAGKKVYVIGQEGICEELALHSIPFIGGPADAQKTAPLHPGGQLEVDPDIGAVVVGLDTQINYYKIQYAQLCLNTLPSCLFLATNQDAVTHLTDAQEWAGSGAIVGAIRGCTGRDPVVVGKPSSLLLDYIARTLGVDKGRMCMVGDRLDTDVLFGQRSGLRTVLTLSGVTRECILLSDANTILPDHYVNSIADFFAD